MFMFVCSSSSSRPMDKGSLEPSSVAPGSSNGGGVRQTRSEEEANTRYGMPC